MHPNIVSRSWVGKVGSFCLLWCRDRKCDKQMCQCGLLTLSHGIVHNVCVCDVAGIGSLAKSASADGKADQLRPIPRHNVNKETESNEDTEPGHCTSIFVAGCAAIRQFLTSSLFLSLVFEATGFLSPYFSLVVRCQVNVICQICEW